MKMQTVFCGLTLVAGAACMSTSASTSTAGEASDISANRAAAIPSNFSSFAAKRQEAAQESAGSQDLAKKLSNPVADLISFPEQVNYDSNIGASDGVRRVVNVQPVAPFSLSENWNVISRTIIPLIDQDDVAGNSGHQTGVGDIVQSFFFSPKKPTASGLVWGVGPVLLLPTASDDLLGSDKWGAGPTAVLLKQAGPWTYGALANHIWSFAGDDGRADINATFLQPFASYSTPTAWTFSVNTESTYDWQASEWSIPINGVVSKVTRFGTLPISVFGGLRYWADSPSSGPDGLGFRVGVTLLFPKG